MLTCVLLTGGSGTRLWPLSRRDFPKQFLALDNEASLLENTVQRMRGICADQQLLAVGGEAHRFIVREHLDRQDAHAAPVLLEPCARNTAPAVTLAALHAAATTGPDTILLVSPADHVVRDQEAFKAAVRSAMPLAQAGALVTFGIQPDRPETGYGYIQAGAQRPDGAFDIARFVEKPDLATAQSYLQDGGYTWNAGVFVFTADTLLSEMRQFAPDIVRACEEALAGETQDGLFVRVDAQAFAACPEDSIDYAVMEKTDKAVVLPLDCGWNDVGSFNYLRELGSPDAEGNVQRGDVHMQDCRNTSVLARSRLVAAVGLDDLVVVETDDAVLVSRADRLQEVKTVAKGLDAQGRNEAVHHPQVFRPWGSYEGVDAGPRHQVKRIVVKPGQKLSLQMHHHRAEHWIVVKGTAKVSCGDKTFLLTEDQSTYIPLGTTHRLENPGTIPLELIEVQTGSYLGEDDIVRFEDDYGRKQ
nr:mannose-1-phosphate guanylyltransferase/mannose-6-phosphate isomerase [Oceanococcus sp. HetDA_MAG_MS8]